MAFKFRDDREKEILAYLTEREGKNFLLKEFSVQLENGDEVTAIAPVYRGKNLIEIEAIENVAKRILEAKGKCGRCVDYVKGIADQLRSLEIEDQAVTELWHQLTESGT